MSVLWAVPRTTAPESFPVLEAMCQARRRALEGHLLACWLMRSKQNKIAPVVRPVSKLSQTRHKEARVGSIELRVVTPEERRGEKQNEEDKKVWSGFSCRSFQCPFLDICQAIFPVAVVPQQGILTAGNYQTWQLLPHTQLLYWGRIEAKITTLLLGLSLIMET